MCCDICGTNGPREVESGTAQVEGKCGHASGRQSYVEDKCVQC